MRTHQLAFSFFSLLLLLLIHSLNGSSSSLVNFTKIKRVSNGDFVKGLQSHHCQGSLAGGFLVSVLLDGIIDNINRNKVSVIFTKQNSDKTVEIDFNELQGSSTMTLRNSMTINFFAPNVALLHQQVTFTAEYRYLISIKIDSKLYSCQNMKNWCLIIFRDIYSPKIDIIANPVLISGMKLIQRAFLRKDYYRHNSFIRILKIDNQLPQYNPFQLKDAQYDEHHMSVIFATQLQNFQSILSRDEQNTLTLRAFRGDACVYDRTKSFIRNGDQFYVRVLPTIDSIDFHEGSKQGGQLLTIKGKSWIKDKTKFLFQNDKECKIVKFQRVDFGTSDYTATCRTQSNSISASPTSAVGGHGILHQIYLEQTSYATVRANLATKTPNFKTLLFNAQTPIFDQRTHKKNHVTRSRTFFKAPSSGVYNFLATSREKVEIKLHTTPNVIPAAFGAGDLTFEVSAYSFRDPFKYYQGMAFKTKSSSVTLVKDNYYYMEIWTEAAQRADDNDHNAHTSIGFISDSSNGIEESSIPQIQRLAYKSPPLVFDKYEFIVEGLANSFSISYRNRWNAKVIIQGLNSASNQRVFKGKIFHYFQRFNDDTNDFIVVKDFLDSSKDVTVIDANKRYVRYTIHMKKIRTPPREAVGTPQFTLQYETIGNTCTTPGNNCEIRFSSGQPAQSGTWKFIVTDPFSNQRKTSKSFKFRGDWWEIKYQLWKLVPQFAYNVDIDFNKINSSNIQKSIQGYEIFIRFTNFHKQVAQITLDISDLKWGNGDKPLTSQATTIQDFSNTEQMFFPAPYQFFFTPHKEEQIRVVVNDNILGVCNRLADDACDYKFVDQSPQITNASINLALRQIDITGTNFLTRQQEYEIPIFSGFETIIGAITSTSIKLSYTRLIAGPNYLPDIVLKNSGKIKTTLGGAHILRNQNISIASITPNTIHWKGGISIIITMNNNLLPFGSKVQQNFQLQIKVDGSDCESVKYISRSQLQCISPITRTIGTRTLQVMINSIRSTTNINIVLNADARVE